MPRPPRPAPAPGALGRDLPPPPGVTLVEGGADVAVYAGHADGVEVRSLHRVRRHALSGDRERVEDGGGGLGDELLHASSLPAESPTVCRHASNAMKPRDPSPSKARG